MQTNLHRVSEYVVTPKQALDDTRIKPDERTAIKRLREHDSDSESDAEESFSNSNIQPALTDYSTRDGGPFDTGIGRTDPTVFLSFDWENEVPYEKAVNRYGILCHMSASFGSLASVVFQIEIFVLSELSLFDLVILKLLNVRFIEIMLD